MSGKKLLAENTIRRFMKLANVEPLTSSFIAENYEEEEPLEEAEEELELDMGEEAPEGDLEPEPEPELDMGVGDEESAMGDADMSLTEEEARLLVDLGERLAVALEGADTGEEEPEFDDEAPLDDEMPVEDEPALEDEEEVPPAALQERKEALVQEILKRVTKRIVSARSERK